MWSSPLTFCFYFIFSFLIMQKIPQSDTIYMFFFVFRSISFCGASLKITRNARKDRVHVDFRDSSQTFFPVLAKFME